MKNALWTEPVLTFLTGLAVAVDAVLVALVALGALDWTKDQTAYVVAAVSAVCLLAAAVVRSMVVSPATDAERSRTAYNEGLVKMQPSVPVDQPL